MIDNSRERKKPYINACNKIFEQGHKHTEKVSKLPRIYWATEYSRILREYIKQLKYIKRLQKTPQLCDIFL